eukprot:397436_1
MTDMDCTTLHHPDMANVLHDIDEQIILSETRNGGDARYWKNCRDRVLILAEESKILTKETFEVYWRKVNGMPFHGLMSLNMFTRILGGSNEEWIKLQEKNNAPTHIINALHEDPIGLTAY